jgi:D-aminoacyl-tRNA deacylase
MKAVLQRVTEASVSVDGTVVGAIGPGLLALIGIAGDDTAADRDWLVRKIVQMRIFDDANGVMNRSVLDTGGDVLAVSQFTLFASTRKGNRPSWSAAAPPAIAQSAFNAVAAALQEALRKPVPTGVFGAAMTVHLTNAGPVTICLDSRARE